MIRRFTTTAAASGIALLMAAPAFMAAPAMAQTAASSPHSMMDHGQMTTSQSDSPIIAFAITEEVRSTPDRATVGAGVQTIAHTAMEAMRQNAAAMDRLVRAIRARGVAERDVQTSGINLS
ncbi:MAG: SIMPL domain-containing protein, partial [Sphingopyxis sp.]